MSKKKPCGLDYCPQEEIIGAYASCTACAMSDYQATNTAVQPQLRYCREKQCHCTNANWYGECSITACNKVRFSQKIYGNVAKQVIIDERIEK